MKTETKRALLGRLVFTTTFLFFLALSITYYLKVMYVKPLTYLPEPAAELPTPPLSPTNQPQAIIIKGISLKNNFPELEVVPTVTAPIPSPTIDDQPPPLPTTTPTYYPSTVISILGATPSVAIPNTAQTYSGKIIRQIVNLQGVLNIANEDNGLVQYGQNGCWLGNGYGLSTSYLSLRFESLSVPQSAHIVSARIEVHSRQEALADLQYELSLSNEGSTPKLTSYQTFSAINTLHPPLYFQDKTKWSKNQLRSLGEFSSLLQQITDRSDWQNGNSLTVRFKGIGQSLSRKYFYCNQSSTILQPKLIVDFQTE